MNTAEGTPFSFDLLLNNPLALSSSENISSIANVGLDVFVGGSKGTLLKYSVTFQYQNKQRTYTSSLKASVNCGKKGVTQLHVVGGVIQQLIVLCDGVVSFRSLTDLSLIKTIPNLKSDVNLFCANDGNPFYGFCVSTKNKLIVYDLEQELTICKTLTLPEGPKAMKWIRKFICIGFRNEYSILDPEGGSPKGLQNINGTSPVIEILPTDDIALTFKNKTLFKNVNRKKSREDITFQNSPVKLVFSFPFLVSISSDGVEVRNIMKPTYSEIIKKPDVKAICSDGGEIVLGTSNQIFYFCPSHHYRLQDTDMFGKIVENPPDKHLFSSYLESIFSNPNNPFTLLLDEQTSQFSTRFPSLENQDLLKLKNYIHFSIRKLIRIFLSYFKSFKIRPYQDWVYSSIQTISFARFYKPLFGFTLQMTKESEKTTSINLTKYQDIGPGNLGAGKRFWLTRDSLQDPPSKKKTDLIKVEPNNTPELDRKNTFIEMFSGTLEEDEWSSQPSETPTKELLENSTITRLRSSHVRTSKRLEPQNDLLMVDLLPLSKDKRNPVVTASFKLDEENNIMMKYDNQEVLISRDKIQLFQDVERIIGTESGIQYSISFKQPSQFIEIAKQLDSVVEKKSGLPVLFPEAIPPYHSAIQCLKKLSALASPRDKLFCILKSVREVGVCVTNFWKLYDLTTEVGGDDLVPLVTYVILKANIPNLYTEMTYIFEFTTNVELQGQSSYAFATFQIGVEAILRLDDSVYSNQQKSEAPPPRETNQRQGIEQRVEHLHRRVSKIVPFDCDDY